MTEKPNNDNLAIWNEVDTTNPEYTKTFNRGGGFKGTSTNATYLAKKATKLFGPVGIGWGYNVVDESYQPGQDKDVIHIVRIKFWYNWNGQRGEIEHFGQTQFVGKNRNGYYTDEEAPKKSLTDALSKCLSMLGFSADIFLGLYDDNRYVNDLRRDFRGDDEFDNDNRGADRGENRADDGDGKSSDKGGKRQASIPEGEQDEILDRWEKRIDEATSVKAIMEMIADPDFTDQLKKLHIDDETFIRGKANDKSQALKQAKTSKKSNAAA